MPIVAFAAASLIALPVPRDSRQLVENYPASAIMQEKSGAARIRVLINPNGKPYRCELIQLFGDQVFAKAACDAYSRIQTTVPRKHDGQPAYAVASPLARYTLAGFAGERVRQIPNPVDVGLSTASVSTPVTFSIAIEVETDGKVSYCEANGEARPELLSLACADLQTRGRFVVTNEKGEPVSYVTSLEVRVMPKASN